MNIDNIATVNNLGTLLGKYELDFWRKYTVLSLVVIPSVTIIFSLKGLDKSEIFVLIIVVSILFNIIFIIFYLFRRSTELYLYDNGLIYRRRQRMLATRYEDIQEVVQKIANEKSPGITGSILYKYTLFIKDRVKPLHLSEFVYINEIGEFLQYRVSEYNFIQICTAFANSEIRFGQLCVSSPYLEYKDKQFDWNNIKFISFNGQHVVIKLNSHTVQVPIANISNLYMFLKLVHEVVAIPSSINAGARGNDLWMLLRINSNDVENGCEREVEINHKETCSQCNGSGKINCRDCEVCSGKGRIQVSKTIKITLPSNSEAPGIINANTRLKIPAEGDAGIMGGENGDLYIQLII